MKARIALILMVVWLAAASAPLTVEDHKDSAPPPPFTAEAFWQKALALLNERNGYVTPRVAHPVTTHSTQAPPVPTDP